MRIISIKTLKDFYEMPEYRDSKSHLESWYAEARHATWRTPAEIKRQYANGSIIHGNHLCSLSRAIMPGGEFITTRA